MDLDKLTPMFVDDKSGQHYYVNEIAQLVTGSFVIPKQWILREGKMHMDGYDVKPVNNVCVCFTRVTLTLTCHFRTALLSIL